MPPPTTCHAQVYANCKPTKVFCDWAKAGIKECKPKKDKYVMKDYHWKNGEFIWKEAAKPVCNWYGGFMKRVLLEDKLDLTQEVINITEPRAFIKDPNSKFAPFKFMTGLYAPDADNKYLLVPHQFRCNKEDKTVYWKHCDRQKTFTDGMKAACMPYSGKFE